MVKDLNDPTNRDTVPAMLTPGEFVLNKEASQMYAPIIEQMNAHGLQARVADNKNIGGKISKLHGEGYTAPGQAYAIAKDMGYNLGGFVSFLKEKEGWDENAYQDDAGVWTIGYGRTGGIKPGDKTTREAENTWLDKRAQQELDAVDAYAKQHGYEWSPNQKQALASFRYNGGAGMLDQLTDGGTRTNEVIQQKLPQYNKVTDPNTGKKVFVQGLQNRRDAELELWGGKGNQVAGDQAVPVAEAPPTPAPEQGFNTQVATAQPTAPAMEEAPATDAGGGFSGDILNQLAGGLGPQQMAPVPQVGLQGQNPEYIPSVTAQSPISAQTQAPQQPAFQKDEFGINQIVNPFGTYNGGGPVQYLNRGGRGKVKAWDGTKYIWVDPTDPRAKKQKALAAEAPKKQTAPLQFAQAAINAQQQAAQPQRQFQDTSVQPLGFVGPDQDPYGSTQIGRHFSNPINMLDNQGPGAVPTIDDQPPVPGSDEAILQGSSQQVEGQEAERARQNALLGDYAKQFPKGDPRRAAAFNQQQHQKGAVHPGVQAELPPTAPPPAPTYPNQAPAGQGAPTSLAGLTEEEIGTLYDQGNPAAIAYAENEEKQQLVTQALDQNRLNQSVAAPETEGAEILRQQEAALQEQLAGLQTTPAGVTVGEAGSVPALNNPPPQAPVRPDAWSEAVLPEDVQESIGGLNFQADAPSGPAGQDPRREGTAEQKQSATPQPKSASPDEQKAAIKEAAAQSEETAPTVTPEERQNIVDKGRQMGERMSNGEREKVAGTIRETFGDLFDKKELARMGVLMLGAMATGMSPGQALAFAGTQYINRIDSKAATMQSTQKELLKGGKYTPASIKAYTESGDASLLIATDPAAAITQTGEFKNFYGPGGKKVRAQKVKSGDNTLWLDGSGKPVNGFDYHDNPGDVQGTKEYNTRVRQAQGEITKQVKSLREQLDEFEIDGQTSSRTDINPESQGPEIAKWAIDNGVNPADVGTLVESAYHDMINDNRQDGSRARSIVPYLNQLTIRGQVGANADAFLAKGYDGSGPKQYVSGKKMAIMNKSVSNLLRQSGHQGGAQDLANLFYDAALSDWNNLDPDSKKQYERRALKDESGFYVFAQTQLNNKIGG